MFGRVGGTYNTTRTRLTVERGRAAAATLVVRKVPSPLDTRMPKWLMARVLALTQKRYHGMHNAMMPEG